MNANQTQESPSQTVARRSSLPVSFKSRLESSASVPAVDTLSVATVPPDANTEAQTKVSTQLLAVAEKHYPGIGENADMQARAAQAAQTFVRHGLDTPEKIDAWTKGAHVHDVTTTLLGMGFFDNIGYATAMEAFFNNILPTPKSCDTLAKAGAFIGACVGGLDTVVSAVGGSMLSEKLYNDRDCNEKLPSSLAAHAFSGPKTVLNDAARATLANVVKNGGLRVPASAFIPAHDNGMLSRHVRNETDTGLDAIGGFFSAAVNKTLKLQSGIPYGVRLAYRSDLEEVIGKTQKSWAAAIKETPAMIGRGVKGLASPVPLAAAAMITGYVSALFAANDAVGKSFAAQGHQSYGDELTRGEAAARAMVSTVMMGAMTGTIYIAAPAIQIGTERLTDWLSTMFSGTREGRQSDIENQTDAPDSTLPNGRGVADPDTSGESS